MRIFKFLFSLSLTLALIYFLDNRWIIEGSPVPPIGKFLDPFHGFWQNIEPAEYAGPETLDIPGLKDQVTVIYDSLLIPHIFANNEEDLCLAQGYITAMHRLWQMEFQTHAAAGRISELIGDVALDYDRKQRRLGMVFGAENFIDTIMTYPEAAMAIDKYTEGVNAYIASLDYKDLPFEYKLLDYRPEEWTPLKMGLLLKNLSQTLNISESDFEMTNALHVFGKDVIDLLYRENENPIEDPIVSNPKGWNFKSETLDDTPLAVPDGFINIPTDKQKRRGIGSNNWAVHGSKTATGAPILCNDPHLTLSYPSIWYVVHLNAPTVNTMGGSLPGCPYVVLGFNDSIAWGCTNAQRDLADWYKIQFRSESRDEYLSDGQWKQVTKRIEEFRIRDGEPYYDTILFTHHGPVVYERNFHGDGERNNYAFRWLAHDGSTELMTLYHLNKGKNFSDYEKALNYWSGPAQNFAFASVDGDIAIRIQGKFPVRRRGEGRFVLDGTTTNTEWKKFIPFGQNVMSKNPQRGFISSANQFPVDETYPYYAQSDWFEAFRNRRINAVLSSKNNIRPEDMMALQNDNFNLQAFESLPTLMTLLDTATLQGEERRVAETLLFWDFMNNRESVAATYYEAWWTQLMRYAWDEMRRDTMLLETPETYSMIRLIKENQDLPLWDIVSTPEKETLADIVKASFRQSVKDVQEWERKHHKPALWADYKDTYVEHLLRIAPLSTHVRVGGNGGIVNAADHRTGPSWRFIVSLEKPQVRAWGVYPAGQSGNPGSRFYDNLVQHWADGKYYPLVFSASRDAVAARALYTTRLTPDQQ